MEANKRERKKQSHYQWQKKEVWMHLEKLFGNEEGLAIMKWNPQFICWIRMLFNAKAFAYLKLINKLVYRQIDVPWHKFINNSWMFKRLRKSRPAKCSWNFNQIKFWFIWNSSVHCFMSPIFRKVITLMLF